MSTPAERLHTFVNFVTEHLKGDEKGEAQLFLDKFFRAFGHEGAIVLYLSSFICQEI